VPGPDYSAVQRNMALEIVRVTEAAALASGRWLGRGDKEAADQVRAFACTHAGELQRVGLAGGCAERGQQQEGACTQVHHLPRDSPRNIRARERAPALRRATLRSTVCAPLPLCVCAHIHDGNALVCDTPETPQRLLLAHHSNASFKGMP